MQIAPTQSNDYLDFLMATTGNRKTPKQQSLRGSIQLLERLVKQAIPSVGELVLGNDPNRPAIIDINTRKKASHGLIHNFIDAFDLGLGTSQHGKPRVAVMLPNGPFMALACLCVSTYYTLVPLSTGATPEQLNADLDQTQPDAILMLETDAHRFHTNSSMVVFTVIPRPDLTFSIRCPSPHRISNHAATTHNVPDDVAIILFTSGSTGAKKLVPITTYNLLAGTAFTIESLGLTAKDRCLNMMPLHHVGGLMRIICCSSFDPSTFWDVISQWHPTWYYATPTMHQMILAESQYHPDAVRQSSIQLICNAGAGIPPALANQLNETFKCAVFPSYGMTECAPISAPPLNYRLERPGTSGIGVGPELAIMENPDFSHPAHPGVIGNICVRGTPVFEGYLTPDGYDRKAFNKDGWFNTGDLGYVDEDGYLYITGRSKEVINRGGEIISPVEVEDAIFSASRDPKSIIFGRIQETLAFPVPHEVLQEVVGVVIVCPPKSKRPDIRQLHKALQAQLSQSKWPMVLVYMNGIPKSNNKIQRIGMSTRLQLEKLADSTLPSDCHYEARCPSPSTPLISKITKKRCTEGMDGFHVSLSEEQWMPDILMRRNKVDGFLEAILFFQGHCALTGEILISYLHEAHHGYLVPSSVKLIQGSLPLDEDGNVDIGQVEVALREHEPRRNFSQLQLRVQTVFATALRLSPNDVTPETDFFAAGGDSLTAGRMVSQLRRDFNIHIPGDFLFRHSDFGTLCNVVERAVISQKMQTGMVGDLPGCVETYSSTNPVLLLIHLLPIAVFYPMKQALQWTLFIHAMAETSFRFPLRGLLVGRLLHIVIIAAGSRIVVQLIAPLVGILFKWIVIGRYRSGIYPMWGVYHTRWWITQKALQVCGKGLYNQYNWSRILYYRALGATIGRNVTIHELASLGEYDLIKLGDNVILDHCICRPFAVERNTSMLLKSIKLGTNCCVGLKSVVAPGADIAPGTCLGPNSSSWEVADADESNWDSLSAMVPESHWMLTLLLVAPLGFLVSLARRLPWLAGLLPIVVIYPRPGKDMVHQTILWFTKPQRIAYHILARIYLAIAGPIVMFLTVIFIKRFLDVLCRKPTPGRIERSQPRKLRSTILAHILPRGDIHTLTRLVGRHYELVSVVVRALGARVGKRVYWPSVFPSVQDFDLLDIGNDVVFGSGSHLVTSDGLGKDRIEIGDGAMIGDRAVLQPGVIVGTRTMVGSGALLRRNGIYPSDTVWTGSKRGDAILFPSPAPVASDMASEKSLKTTTRPFGRAFYLGKANYRVLGQLEVVCYSTIVVILVTVYWLVTPLVGLLVLRRVLQVNLPIFGLSWWRPFLIYAVFCSAVSTCSLLQSLLALAVVVATKWALMGRRLEGEYHWDKSSYNQRWQLYLTIESLIKDSYGGLGILQLLSGTWYLALYYRSMGARIGRNCSLFANGSPNIYFTEPDLLTIGNRVAIDDASLVCHLNSRGEFELHELRVGDRSILRTGSRLMSGASMGNDACLLEHTLVLSGDHVDDGKTLQGWPAELFEGLRI
ncbi:hypothetical protein BDV59DRAFT_209777 [Aspergillus ambiguus]|uniref:uncharacterized protein n=1 Tax=Aspergillus ambiguus TaxID=176160 RepID=UPI003CCDDD77